jgi:hypothetical protein
MQSSETRGTEITVKRNNSILLDEGAFLASILLRIHAHTKVDGTSEVASGLGQVIP